LGLAIENLCVMLIKSSSRGKNRMTSKIDELPLGPPPPPPLPPSPLEPIDG
jgi:hypothetical protein